MNFIKYKKILISVLSITYTFASICNPNINLVAKADISVDDIVKSTKILQEELAKVEGNKENKKSEERKNISKMRHYMTVALNPQNAYMRLDSGNVKNHRILDGNKKEVTVDSKNIDSTWLFNRDKGEGSPNFLRNLFPSSSGDLNTEGGYDDIHCFSRDVSPDPVLIARIVNICYMYRNIDDFRNNVVDPLLNALMSSKNPNLGYFNINCDLVQEINDENNLKEKIQNLIDEKSSFKNIKELFNLIRRKSINGKKIKFDRAKSDLVKKHIEEKGLFENKSNLNHKQILEEILDFLQKNDNKIVSKILDFSKNFYDKNFEANRKTYTFLNLVFNMLFMIKNQEENGIVDPDRFFPKFTAEQMLMTYFIKKFNTEENIREFYQNVIQLLIQLPSLTCSVGEEEELKDQETKISNANIIFEKLKNEKIFNPYGENRLSDYVSVFELKVDESLNNCNFLNNTFSNCAEMAIKHISNLLLYSREGNWNFINDHFKLRENDLNRVTDLITKCENPSLPYLSLPYLSFKDRLIAFLKFQKDNGVNNISDAASNMWNYVISNMQEEKRNVCVNIYNRQQRS